MRYYQVTRVLNEVELGLRIANDFPEIDAANAGDNAVAKNANAIHAVRSVVGDYGQIKSDGWVEA